jgi:hypothetical protein
MNAKSALDDETRSTHKVVNGNTISDNCAARTANQINKFYPSDQWFCIRAAV